MALKERARHGLRRWRARRPMNDMKRDRLSCLVDGQFKHVRPRLRRLERSHRDHRDPIEPVLASCARLLLGPDLQLSLLLPQWLSIGSTNHIPHRVIVARAKLITSGKQTHHDAHPDGRRKLREPERVDPGSDHRGKVVVNLAITTWDDPVDVQRGGRPLAVVSCLPCALRAS